MRFISIVYARKSFTQCKMKFRTVYAKKGFTQCRMKLRTLLAMLCPL